MYKSIVDIKKEVPQDVLEKLIARADKAFDNRVGKAKNVSTIPYRLIYAGEEDLYGCLQLGMLELEEEKDFLDCVSAWTWIDEDYPWRKEDILAEMKRPVR